MTENDLVDLGFTKIEYTKKDLEELGDSSDPYRYYTYLIYREEDDLFDTGLFRWYEKEDIKNLIKLLKDGLLID